MASSLFLVPYPPGRASSQRFRFEQHLDALTTAGHQYRLVPFLDVATWAMLYKPGQTRRKELGILVGLWRRLIQLFSVSCYDFIFIHHEAAPIVPLVLEWIIAKVLGRRIICDYDDAIWTKGPAGEQGILAG